MSLVEFDPLLEQKQIDIGRSTADDFNADLEAGELGRTFQFYTDGTNKHSAAHYAQHTSFLEQLGVDGVKSATMREYRVVDGFGEPQVVEAIKCSDKAVVIRGAILACSMREKDSSDPNRLIKIGWMYQIVSKDQLTS